MNTVLTFTVLYTKLTFCLIISDQLLECDNALWVRVYNKIICIPMGSCIFKVVPHFGSCSAPRECNMLRIIM